MGHNPETAEGIWRLGGFTPYCTHHLPPGYVYVAVSHGYTYAVSTCWQILYIAAVFVPTALMISVFYVNSTNVRLISGAFETRQPDLTWPDLAYTYVGHMYIRDMYWDDTLVAMASRSFSLAAIISESVFDMDDQSFWAAFLKMVHLRRYVRRAAQFVPWGVSSELCLVVYNSVSCLMFSFVCDVAFNCFTNWSASPALHIWPSNCMLLENWYIYLCKVGYRQIIYNNRLRDWF